MAPAAPAGRPGAVGETPWIPVGLSQAATSRAARNPGGSARQPPPQTGSTYSAAATMSVDPPPSRDLPLSRERRPVQPVLSAAPPQRVPAPRTAALAAPRCSADAPGTPRRGRAHQAEGATVRVVAARSQETALVRVAPGPPDSAAHCCGGAMFSSLLAWPRATTAPRQGQTRCHAACKRRVESRPPRAGVDGEVGGCDPGRAW